MRFPFVSRRLPSRASRNEIWRNSAIRARIGVMRYPERVRLANLPTPIQFLPRLSLELRKEIYVWRDDLTGFSESGNKVRKLEFLVTDALQRKANVLVTCGGPQSNHARATAFLARRLGLGIELIVRKPKTGIDPSQETVGNFLLNRLLGAEIELVEFADYQARGAKYDWFLERKAEAIKARGGKPYLIPEGGSCALGCFGYIAGVEEMLASWAKVCPDQKGPSSIVTALGSGGTYAGLHLGLETRGFSSAMLHAVSVCDDAKYFENRINGLFDDVEREYGIKAKSRAMRIHDGYSGLGYAQATDDELRFYAAIARQEGLLLDPCYTGKAFLGMVTEIRKDPSQFGNRVLFLHSGGGFGMFSYGDQYLRALS